MTKRKLARGNVLRSPHNGGLVIVIDPEINMLIPIGSTNCVIYAPEEDRYGKHWVYNKSTGEEDLIKVVESYSVDKYSFVASTVQDLIMDRFKELFLK